MLQAWESQAWSTEVQGSWRQSWRSCHADELRFAFQGVENLSKPSRSLLPASSPEASLKSFV
eukprot:2619623-Amphidinium_carterae.1